MKKLNLLLFSLILTVFFIASCNKVEEVIIEMSDEEAVETIEQCLAGEAGGFTEYMESLITVYQSTNDSCSLSGDTTIATSSSVGLTTYSYASIISYTLNCSGLTPNDLSISLNSSGSFDAPRVSADDTAGGTSTLSNLSSGSAYDFDGVYNKSGTLVSKIGQKGNFQFSFAMTGTDIMIDKTTHIITGGTATFTFAGVGNNIGGTSFNYIGDITFNGNGSATVTLSGNNHTITIN